MQITLKQNPHTNKTYWLCEVGGNLGDGEKKQERRQKYGDDRKIKGVHRSVIEGELDHEGRHAYVWTWLRMLAVAAGHADVGKPFANKPQRSGNRDPRTNRREIDLTLEAIPDITVVMAAYGLNKQDLFDEE